MIDRLNIRHILSAMWLLILSSSIFRHHEAMAWLVPQQQPRPRPRPHAQIRRTSTPILAHLNGMTSTSPRCLAASSRFGTRRCRASLGQTVADMVPTTTISTTTSLCTDSSPFSSQSSSWSLPLSNLEMDDHKLLDNKKLLNLCRSLPTLIDDLNDNDDDVDNVNNVPIRFDTSGDEGIRGIYLARSFQKDETILAIPLDSMMELSTATDITTTTTKPGWFGCLVDQQPPTWLPEHVKTDPNKWATRLAAAWLDLYLQHPQQQQQQQMEVYDDEVDEEEENDDVGNFDTISLWLDLLPKAEELRASLPVHWSEDTLRKAKCTTLELAVDSAFFVRGEAMADLMEGLQASPYQPPQQQASWQGLCEYALNLIQTRSCRLESSMVDMDDEDRSEDTRIGSNYIRVLAPIFDFINHGGPSFANAYFELANRQSQETSEMLVVKALRDMDSGEELLIDYGIASTWPSWKCLFSYGFVPQYRPSKGTDELDDEAEVYVAGARYEVSTDTIPAELVIATSGGATVPDDDSSYQDDDTAAEGIELSPDVATRLANRITAAAYNLILEVDDDFDEDEDEDDPSLIIAEQLAANLRWSQHRVLRACGVGLASYAEQLKNDDRQD
jgi:SET domain